MNMKTTCDISFKKWLTEEEAVIYCGLSRSSLQKARLSGSLPFFELMGKIMYETEIIDGWVVRNRKLYNESTHKQIKQGVKP